MIETYVSIGKVTDYAIGVLKYFATASSILLISIIGALTAWIFLECCWYDCCHRRYSNSNHCIDLGNL